MGTRGKSIGLCKGGRRRAVVNIVRDIRPLENGPAMDCLELLCGHKAYYARTRAHPSVAICSECPPDGAAKLDPAFRLEAPMTLEPLEVLELAIEDIVQGQSLGEILHAKPSVLDLFIASGALEAVHDVDGVRVRLARVS